jgi:subtilisin family serine protease
MARPSKLGNAKFWKQLDVVRDALRAPDEPGSAVAADSLPAIEIAVARTPQGGPDFVYQAGVIVTQAAHLDLVTEELGRARYLGSAPIQPARHEPTDDVVLLDIGDRRVLETLDHLDEVLGEGKAAPNHILSICPVSMCPADEPVPAPAGAAPYPGVGPVAAGQGTSIHVIDTGLVDDCFVDHAWLYGIDGGPRLPHPEGVIPEYLGHGTFIAGVVRCMAPGAAVYVSNELRRAGAITEMDLRDALKAVLAQKPLPDIINLSAGGTTRTGARSGKPRSHLGLDHVLGELRAREGLVLVAAAGNDNNDVPFFPAALADGEAVISVGALASDRLHRACYSNYGGWVNVYAPGTKLLNAFTSGSYTYLHAPEEHCTSDAETPAVDAMVKFTGMARWSGTSFAAPLVAGLIARRMSETSETNARVAAKKLLAEDARPDETLGRVLLPPA